MKRKIAFLLAVILIVSTGFMAYATGVDNGTRAAETEQESSTQPGGSVSDSDSENSGLPEDQISGGTEGTGKPENSGNPVPGAGTGAEIQPPVNGDAAGIGNAAGKAVSMGDIPQDTGEVYVSIGMAQTLYKSAAFQVSLRGSGVDRSDVIQIGGGSAAKSTVQFVGLADGEYTLTVSAQGYATYTQTVRVEGRAYTVNLTTGFREGIPYEAGVAHPGVLAIGDVAGNDGVINEADKTAMVDAVDRKAGSGLTDLNGDGVVNLADLEYFAQTYNDHRDMQAGVEKSVPRAVITPSAGNGTQIEGDLQALLGNSGSVTLKQVWGEAISEECPVSLKFEFDGSQAATAMDGIIIGNKSDNPVTKMAVNIVYLDENGVEQQPVEKEFTIEGENGLSLVLEESAVEAKRDAQGNIRLFLGSQVAVKRVTLIIKGTRQSSNLAEISKVEFVNGMEERIPEPQMDIPKNLTAVAGGQQISLSWDPCINVTGYEVAIWQEGEGKEVETITVRGNALDITSYMKDELTNYEKYYMKVQAANGTWRSGYGDTVEAIPQPSGPPDPPDFVNAAGQFRSVIVSWKDMEDTVSYNVYFKAKEGEEEFRKIAGNIKENRYTISGLEDLTAYQVYVTGVNELGESGPSIIALAITTDAKAAVMPKYKLINTGESGQKGAHIISTYRGEGSMVDSPLDTESNTAWGTVDHEPASHYFADTWDEGGFNQMQSRHGLTYEFDETYTIDRFAFHDVTSQYRSYDYVSVRCWDENGELTYSVNQMGLSASSDKDGKAYYMVKLPRAVEAKKIQFGIARNYWGTGGINISEVYFYYYDSVYDDIMALYQDDLHLVLKPEVTQKTIDELRKRINTVDEVSGELHPDYEILERELKNAEDILNAVGLSEPVRIHNTIRSDGSRGFGGLNAWQPIGVTAAAEDKIVVYVGHNTKRTGDTTNLQLVATQYNSEAASMFSGAIALKVGANEITVPKMGSLNDESGGALYVQYTGNNANDQYAVRVSGGVHVPILDLYHVTDEAARMAKTVEYVEKLGTYVSQMEDTHEREHYYSNNKWVNKRKFDNQTCILGASDIMLDTMMFSLPAQQIWAGSAKNGTDTESRARTILKSMEAMEDMMYLFYQHKGLNANAEAVVDRIPACHQNIRYQRMFAGAFMYASGNHIGIGWGSTAGMVNCGSLVYDDLGRYQGGNYFGWGIAHEIGHCINQNHYAVAEITNNYFAVLAQAKETNDSVRFKYENVYKKVTSNSKGRASNVFTQLGMYWQLHLAYDEGYNFRTYENHEEQLANLFFARVDTYSRTPSKAPAPGGVSMDLTKGDSDQKLMRLSCAAAEKNILSFFERWGMTPDADTISYAAQFPVETRAIYYVNDEARAYRVQNKATGSILGTEGKVDAVGDAVTAKLAEANKVEINLSSKGIPKEDVLGYEIVRCMYEGGAVQEEPVGFVTGETVTYTDIIATINNRTVFYKITLIDQYLNRSAVKELAPVKIEHDGSLDKAFWTVSTMNLKVEGETGSGSSNNIQYCDPENETTYARDNLIDNQTDTIFTATAETTAPEITLNFNKTLTVAGFKITGGSGLAGVGYEIVVYGEGVPVSVATGTLGTEAVQTIHFANSDDKYISTYEANAVKLILKPAKGSTVSIAELDVLGVTGDNVDFRRTAGDEYVVIGKLKEEFRFGDGADDIIPAGSIIFAGSYKGNAAYNSVLLFDQDGNNVGAVSGTGNDVEVKADSIILADVPETGNIADVKNGTWIYWVEAGTDLSEITKVRAELYRVNNAQTQEGQRLVSDSLFETMPSVLPEVTLDRANMPK